MPPAPSDCRFHEFWARYPRKVAKAEARKAWARLNPTDELIEQIMAALDWQREQEGWQKDDGQFVPYPASYLRGERWEDEAPKARQRQLGDWRFECRQLHGGRCTNVHFHEAMKEKAS